MCRKAVCVYILLFLTSCISYDQTLCWLYISLYHLPNKNHLILLIAITFISFWCHQDICLKPEFTMYYFCLHFSVLLQRKIADQNFEGNLIIFVITYKTYLLDLLYKVHGMKNSIDFVYVYCIYSSYILAINYGFFMVIIFSKNWKKHLYEYPTSLNWPRSNEKNFSLIWIIWDCNHIRLISTVTTLREILPSCLKVS